MNLGNGESIIDHKHYFYGGIVTDPNANSEDVLAAYEDILGDPQRAFTPSDTRAKYAACFDAKCCPKCSSPIDTENLGFVGDILHVICEKCWTVHWLSDKPIFGQAYPVTFSTQRPLSVGEAAILAQQLLDISRSWTVEMFLVIDEDMFPAIAFTGEGWFRAAYVPLAWELDFQDEYDEEEISEFRDMDFAEKISTTRSYMAAALQDYGWEDNQGGFREIFSKIKIEGLELGVEVDEWNDFSVIL